MKPDAAREPEPLTPGRGAEPEGRWRERGEADTERQRTRERQEATLAGLAELGYLRQRQELLVRGALRCSGAAGTVAPRAGELRGDAAQRSRLEEKFLEENILLLRRQLVRWWPVAGRAGWLGWGPLAAGSLAVTGPPPRFPLTPGVADAPGRA